MVTHNDTWVELKGSVLEIIEKCTEAESSEVKSLRWSEKVSNVEGSEVQ